MKKSGTEVTFGLIHGAWHGAWCWDYLSDCLKQAGHDVVATDLPIDDPRKNFDDYADVGAKDLTEHENIYLVGHSRGGNTVPRIAGRIAIEGLIYLCAAFEPATIKRPLPSEELVMPHRYMPGFTDGIIPIGKDMTVYDKSTAREVFYHDCEPEDVAFATGKLRLQRRSENEPELEVWPDLPQISIICADDRVVNPDWQLYVAENWLHADVVEMPGGHSPMLSRPEHLAKVLLDIVS